MASPRAVFLDRDGVLNPKPPDHHYVTRPGDLTLLPGVGEAVARLNGAGWRVIVVTNQRGIARGLMNHGDLLAIHRRLRQLLLVGGGRLDAIHTCPCAPGPACPCRKPEPGMLLRAAERFDLDLGASWMVGDSPSDVVAGQRAGCRCIFIGDGARLGAAGEGAAGEGEVGICGDLPEAVARILAVG